MLGGAGATLVISAPAWKLLPCSSGYLVLASILVIIRLITGIGLTARKLWGWRFNFFTLYSLPVLKMLGTDAGAGREYGHAFFGDHPSVPVVLWLIWAIPNTIYFKKRRFLFNDGKNGVKTGPKNTSVVSTLNTSHEKNTAGETSRVSQSNRETPSPSRQINSSMADCAEQIINTMADQKTERFIEFAEFWEGDMYDMKDEKFYEQAQDEIDSGDILRGLMLKAEVAAGGDSKKARVIYLQARASQLYQEEQARERAKQREEKYLEQVIRDAKKTLKKAHYETDLTDYKTKLEELKKKHPNNLEIANLDYEYSYGILEKRQWLTGHIYIDRFDLDEMEEILSSLNMLIAQYPNCPDREFLVDRQREVFLAFDDNKFRYITNPLAKTHIKNRQYDDAIQLYNEYLSEFSSHADFVTDMLENKIPKLIKKKPPRN